MDYVDNNNVIEGFKNILQKDGYKESDGLSKHDLSALIKDYNCI